MAQKVTSTDIKLALKEFHNGKPSYFITECKTCSTYFPDPQGLLKFDGLAITKSYTKPNIIGYEIKVSRNDFLQDNKWHLYLQYCNEFYFVVPKGLVKKEELPDHVGLIYFNPDTKGLRTVKKALYRQIEEPVGVYKYIIFTFLKGDVIAGDLFIEAKTKMNPSQSITVKKSWIDKAKEQSLAMRKEDYAIAVSFGDPKEYYLIEDNLMEDLYKSREALRAVIDAIGGVDHDPLGLESAEIYRIRELIKEAY